LRYHPTYVCCSDQRFAYEYAQHMLTSKSKFIFTDQVAKVLSKLPTYRPSDTRIVNMITPSNILSTTSFDPNFKKVAWGRTVLIDLCVPLASYLKFDEIYLVGVDWTESAHFYPNNEKNFTKWLRKNPTARQEYSPLPTSRLDRKDKYLKKAAQLYGKPIYDCTVDGKLIMFPKKSLKEVLRK